MRRNLFSSFLTVGLLFSAPSFAGETPISVDKQEDLSVTIYNSNLALVKDVRRVDLPAGKQTIAFEEVSSQIRPETALLLADDLSVIEQNFNFDLLTHENILKKSVGENVRLFTPNKATGETKVETAKVLSVARGLVLELPDRIETKPRGRVVFNAVPEKLRPRPTLLMTVNNKNGKKRPFELSYLTRGMSWKADYIARLSKDEKKLDLNGWVTLTNTSGTSYGDATLQLVAGAVNQVQRPRPMKKFAAARSMAYADEEMAVREEALMDYHLYTLPHKTTLLPNQTKQVALLEGGDVPVEKIYRLQNPVSVYHGTRGEYQPVKPKVLVRFKNKKETGLGLALPKGTIRVYKPDSRDVPLFVGEDSIRHTAENETVTLSLGEAFDVTVKPVQKDYRSLSRKAFEATYGLTLRNAKAEDVTVTIRQSLPDEWRILSETLPHEKRNASEVEWKIPVPSKGETDFSFAVQVVRN